MKFLFVILLSSLFLTSCTSTSNRETASLRFDQNRKSEESSIKELQKRLSETASIAKAGPDGEIVFYYLSKEKIKGQIIDVLNVKVCEPYSVIEKGEDCVSIGKSKEAKVSYELYKTYLRSSIELAIEYSPTVLSAEQMNKILKFAAKV